MPAQGFEPWTIGLKVDFRDVHCVSLKATGVHSEYDRQGPLSTEIRHVSQKFILLAALLAVLPGDRGDLSLTSCSALGAVPPWWRGSERHDALLVRWN